eukprot:jgi/Tetstr1/421694/TSEL_012632.t1
MDPKRDFRLPDAAALASKAKQFGISVATLKNMYTNPAPPSGGEGRSVSSDVGLAASMAAQEMDAELHVGDVIIKTFEMPGAFSAR